MAIMKQPNSEDRTSLHLHLEPRHFMVHPESRDDAGLRVLLSACVQVSTISFPCEEHYHRPYLTP